jgi:hypothetical protein
MKLIYDNNEDFLYNQGLMIGKKEFNTEMLKDGILGIEKIAIIYG